MKSLYHHTLGRWRRLRGSSNTNCVRHLDAPTRRALQSTVQEETDELQTEIAAVQNELQVATDEWNKACDKETFVGVRVQKYRSVLREQAVELRAEREQLKEQQLQQQQEQQQIPDAEDGTKADWEVARAALERRQEKWEKDDKALTEIAAQHKEILVSCEKMRRNIDKLQKKKKQLLSLTGECQEFLDCAEKVRQREENGDDDDDSAVEEGSSGASGSEMVNLEHAVDEAQDEAIDADPVRTEGLTLAVEGDDTNKANADLERPYAVQVPATSTLEVAQPDKAIE